MLIIFFCKKSFELNCVYLDPYIYIYQIKICLLSSLVATPDIIKQLEAFILEYQTFHTATDDRPPSASTLWSGGF